MRSLVQIHSGPPLLCDKRSTVSRVSRWSVYYISGQNRPIFFKLAKPRTSKVMVFSACHGALAQLGERGLCKPEVRGSIPLRSTIKHQVSHLKGSLAFSFSKERGLSRSKNAEVIVKDRTPDSDSCSPLSPFSIAFSPANTLSKVGHPPITLDNPCVLYMM